MLLIENVLDSLSQFTELVSEDVKIRYMGFVLDESIKIKHKPAAKATAGTGVPRKPTEQEAWGYHHSHVIHAPEGGEEVKYTVITGPFGSRFHRHGSRKQLASITDEHMHGEPHPEETIKDPNRLNHVDVVRAFARGLAGKPMSRWHGRGNNEGAHRIGSDLRAGNEPKGDQEDE